ncbi:unnamed protein product [Paramecium sonneborni]|uniref:Uncharacterized protein n=1 Tax=Paramecium sonneborni TaxID=65129 RepID=A0A8S1PF85_9CILI|nr:unnamed protein product [Paramecium sonneborni]
MLKFITKGYQFARQSKQSKQNKQMLENKETEDKMKKMQQLEQIFRSINFKCLRQIHRFLQQWIFFKSYHQNFQRYDFRTQSFQINLQISLIKQRFIEIDERFEF